MKVVKFLSKIFFFSLCLCMGACTTSKAKKEVLIPKEINDTALNGIYGYENMDKKEIENHVSKTIADKNTYSDAESVIVDKFLEQTNSYVTLTAIGDTFDLIDYNNNTGVPFSGTSIGFTFLQNITSSFEFEGKKIEIASGDTKNVGDYKLPAAFKSGAFIIMKSTDNSTWKQEAIVLSTNRFYISYFPEASDVTNGVYYKFVNIVHFKFFSHKETRTSGFWFWKKTWEEDVYASFNVIQQFNVVVGKNSVDIRFTCESIDSQTISGDGLTDEEIGILQKSTTMTDGSVSTSYIKAELLESSNVITYSYLGESSSYSGPLTSSTTFTESGKYTFEIVTFFGNTSTITLYIVHLGEDNGKALFFGDGLIDSSMRVFDPNKAVQTYMVGKSFSLNSIPEYCPGRYGAIYYFKDEESIRKQNGRIVKEYTGTRESETGVFSMQGYYIFDFYNCDLETASGDVFNYRFTYCLVNNPLYAPFVNYSLITNPGRSSLLATKVLSVSLPTTGGGYYQFVYPYSESYVQNAYETAVEIEELSVEIVNQKGTKHYFYKSIDNSNLKIDYSSKIALYESINYYAKKNINVTYLDNSVPFADSLFEGNIKDISTRSITQTIRVVENEQVLNDLRTGDIYLNNFKFTQVADFEVESLTATGESGNYYNIQFDQEVDSLFTKSDKVTIKETNWHKDTVYQTIYSKDNTCEINANYNSANHVIKKSNDGNNLTVSSFKFVSANDKYDGQTLISIDDGSTRKLFSMSEINGLSLPKGQYIIKVINRNNQVFSFNVNRTEDLTANEESYSSFNRNPLGNDILDLKAEVIKETTKQSAQVDVWILIILIITTSVLASVGTFLPTYFITSSNRSKKRSQPINTEENKQEVKEEEKANENK